MTEINPIYNILVGILGEPGHNKSNHSSTQYGFNCPICSLEKGVQNDGKYNLEVNINKNVWKCWVCSDTNNSHGSLLKLVRKYGSKMDVRLLKELLDEFDNNTEVKTYTKKLYLPREFKTFKEGDKRTISYREAYNYMSSRGYGLEILEKYNIGYCDSGKYENRIIIPSYDGSGELNYFTARTYVGHKQKYKNPILPKQDLIINESNINWDSTVILTEGLLDVISLYPLLNVIPLLGKTLSDDLYYKILSKLKGHIIIILDPDAQKDMYAMYKRLHTSHLKDRIRVVDLPGDADLSDIRRDFGLIGVREILKTCRKLTLKDYTKYNI